MLPVSQDVQSNHTLASWETPSNAHSYLIHSICTSSFSATPHSGPLNLLSWIVNIFIYKGGKGITCDPLHTFNSCRNHQLGDTHTRVVSPLPLIGRANRWGKSASIGYSAIPTGPIDAVQLPFRTSFLAFTNFAKSQDLQSTDTQQKHPPSCKFQGQEWHTQRIAIAYKAGRDLVLTSHNNCWK